MSAPLSLGRQFRTRGSTCGIDIISLFEGDGVLPAGCDTDYRISASVVPRKPTTGGHTFTMQWLDLIDNSP